MARRKPRADAVLQNLPPERQEIIAGWVEKPCDRDSDDEPIPGTGGYAFALQQIKADGITVSHSTLVSFYTWWRLEQDLEASFDREEQVLAKTGDPKKAREAGEALLLRLGLASQNPKLIMAAAQTSDARRALDLEEASARTKAEQKNRSLDQKDRDWKLAEKKFQRDTCKLFLKWYDQEEVKRIATGAGSNTDKIEALGQMMFGESWNQ